MASDPGLGRLRMAMAGAVGMATALGVEFGFATLVGADPQGTLIAMLLGAVVAMMGSMALTGSAAWPKARTAVFFPVAIGIGLVAGIAVAANTGLMLTVFVLVMFLAVFVRRFGPAYFFYGFMTWMGYFFASFLHPSWTMLPLLLGAVVVGSAWVLLLSVTVLNTNPNRTLRRIVRAFDARARALARAGVDLLERADDEAGLRRARRTLGRHQSRVAEVALMVEAWSAEPGALPDGWSAPGLRRRLIDAQLALDAIASGADGLAGCGSRLCAPAAVLLDRLARRDDDGAEDAARALADEAADPSSAGVPAARHLAAAALEFVALAGVAQVPPRAELDDEFEPAVGLAMGNLPGPSAVAVDVPALLNRWNPLARLDMTSRQAVQVAVAGALAIVIGRELSATRYYWAVIAVFVMFTGTGTRSETFLKGVNRLLGTLAGLFASIWLAGVTAGNTVAVLVTIVASMFLGFYLMRVSYGFMIFCVTIMVGQLYSALHEFSDGLLVLRLEETAVGAVIGFVVALVVAPLGTRHTVRTVRGALLETVAELLEAVADRIAAEPGPQGAAVPDLDGLARGLDDRFRRLAMVAQPLTRPLLWGNSPRTTRHRLAMFAAMVTHARGLAAAVRRGAGESGPGGAAVPGAAELVPACRSLADAARRMIGAPIGQGGPEAADALAAAESALFGGRGDPHGTWVTDPLRAPLAHLHALLGELSRSGDRTAVAAARPGAAAEPAGGQASRPVCDERTQQAYIVASLARALRLQLDELADAGGPAPQGWWFRAGAEPVPGGFAGDAPLHPVRH